MPVLNQKVYTLLGCDVSNVQGEQIDARGLDFVAAKATQGLTFNDRLFYANRLLAAKNKQLFAAYHFLEKGNGKEQAQHFVNYVNQHGGFSGIGACVDVELQNRTVGPSLADLSAFVAEFHRLVPGKQLLIYSGSWYWKGHLGNPTAFSGYPLWDSAYINGKGTPQQLIHGVTPNYFTSYGGWKKHTIRQFSSSGNVNGHAPIDLDEFEGSVAQLAALFGTAYRPPVVSKPVNPKKPTTHLVVDGALGHLTVSAIQHILIAKKLLPKNYVNGIMDPSTRLALKKYIASKVKGSRINLTNSFFDERFVVCLQQYVGASKDGAWGKLTTEEIQKRINGGRF